MPNDNRAFSQNYSNCCPRIVVSKRPYAYYTAVYFSIREYAEIQLESFILGAESKHVVQMQDEETCWNAGRTPLHCACDIGYDVSKSSGSIKSWSLLYVDAKQKKGRRARVLQREFLAKSHLIWLPYITFFSPSETKSVPMSPFDNCWLTFASKCSSSNVLH